MVIEIRAPAEGNVLVIGREFRVALRLRCLGQRFEAALGYVDQEEVAALGDQQPLAIGEPLHFTLADAAVGPVERLACRGFDGGALQFIDCDHDTFFPRFHVVKRKLAGFLFDVAFPIGRPVYVRESGGGRVNHRFDSYRLLRGGQMKRENKRQHDRAGVKHEAIIVNPLRNFIPLTCQKRQTENA